MGACRTQSGLVGGSSGQAVLAQGVGNEGTEASAVFAAEIAVILCMGSGCTKVLLAAVEFFPTVDEFLPGMELCGAFYLLYVLFVVQYLVQGRAAGKHVLLYQFGKYRKPVFQMQNNPSCILADDGATGIVLLAEGLEPEKAFAAVGAAGVGVEKCGMFGDIFQLAVKFGQPLKDDFSLTGNLGAETNC